MTEDMEGSENDRGGRDSGTIEMEKVCDNRDSGIGETVRQILMQQRYGTATKYMQDNGDGSFGQILWNICIATRMGRGRDIGTPRT